MILRLKNGRYNVPEDTIIDIHMATGVVYEGVRFIGMTRAGDAVKCIAEDGLNEYSRSAIAYVKESHPGSIPVVKYVGK